MKVRDREIKCYTCLPFGHGYIELRTDWVNPKNPLIEIVHPCICPPKEEMKIKARKGDASGTCMEPDCDSPCRDNALRCLPCSNIAQKISHQQDAQHHACVEVDCDELVSRYAKRCRRCAIVRSRVMARSRDRKAYHAKAATSG